MQFNIFYWFYLSCEFFLLFLISLHFLRTVLLLPQHCSTSSFLSSLNIALYSLTIFLKAPLAPPFSFHYLFLSSSSLHCHTALNLAFFPIFPHPSFLPFFYQSVCFLHFIWNIFLFSVFSLFAAPYCAYPNLFLPLIYFCLNFPFSLPLSSNFMLCCHTILLSSRVSLHFLFCASGQQDQIAFNRKMWGKNKTGKRNA